MPQVERIADERGVKQKVGFKLQDDIGDKPAQATKAIGVRPTIRRGATEVKIRRAKVDSRSPMMIGAFDSIS